MRPLVRALLMAVALSVAFPGLALAHPLGNFTVNRYSRLDVARDRVTLRYVLDLAEIPTLQELSAAGLDAAGRSAVRAWALAEKPARLASGAVLVIGGERVAWTIRSAEAELLDGQAALGILRVALTLESEVRAGDGAPLEYRDENYPGRAGWHEVVVRGTIAESTAPATDASDELRRYPNDPTVAPPDHSSASATIRLVGEASDPVRADRGGVGLASPRFGVDAIADGVSGLVRAGSAGDLLATLLALAAAAGIGALHALTPGHGKTIMAAYLVGTRGTPRQALALGIVVAVSHTVGVLGLAVAVLGASALVAPERAYPYLSAVSALIVLGIGVWLVGRSIGGRARARARALGRVDVHPHDHSPAHSHGDDRGPGGGVGWGALATLGVSGGLVPSASAVLLLLAGVSLRRPDLGVLLIVMFGAGMAAVLVGIGLTLVGAARVAERRFGDRPAVRRIASLLPAATGVTVLLVGVGLSLQAGQQMLAAVRPL